MLLNERIQLRDYLFNLFKKYKVIVKGSPNKNSTSSENSNTYQIFENHLINFLNLNPNIKIYYNMYVQEFRSEQEALYCIKHRDDYENHRCPICNELKYFYINHKRHRYQYQKTCKKNECVQARAHSEEADAKYRQSMFDRYGVYYPAQHPMFKAIIMATNRAKGGGNWPMQCEDYKKRFIEAMQKNHGVNWPTESAEILQKIKEANQRNRGYDWPLQDPKVVETLRRNYYKKHIINNPTTFNECQLILDQIKEGLTLIDVYSNNEYFIKFIEMLYFFKSRLLQLKEIKNIFQQNSITNRIYELKLEDYFDIRDSKFEIQFKNLLLNNYKEQKDFTRHNHILRTENGTLQEIDFLVNNIGFEINDLDSHNSATQKSKGKDQVNYHYNKTLMAKDQHNMRLIHLWEWELNETNWLKTSQWILHILNQSKFNITLNDPNNLRIISKKDEFNFLNQYSITSYQESDTCLGIYYDNGLIQTMSFIDNILSICIKPNYSLVNNTLDILKSYMQSKQLSSITTYVDLSKFTGKTFEELGFKLTNYIQPSIISELPNETSTYRKLYNCGYNVYELSI